MTAQRDIETIPASSGLSLLPFATLRHLRALAWHGDRLYASRGYELRQTLTGKGAIEWRTVARFRPAAWRCLTAKSRLASRLVRDGFHALAVLSSGHMAAAVPGAIVMLSPGDTEFRVSHRILRGTRPLHIAATPGGHLFWGEYFDNPQREEVHVYASTDRGSTWQVGYTFPKGAIRHVHNIVYDSREDCLWVLTGDNGAECRVLKATCDLRHVDVVLSGNQQARAVALVPTRDGVYFSSDTPFEENHIYFLDRRGTLTTLATLNGSSIYGCRVNDALFFSTMVEPSEVNRDRTVCVFGSLDGEYWHRGLSWRKDAWPMGLFQYGNAFLPDGDNNNGLLAVSTIAVANGDLVTGLWRVNSERVL